MAYNIIESFKDYLDSLTDDYQHHLIYRGEFVARLLYYHIKDEINTWVVWENKEFIEMCKVEKHDNLIFISEVFSLQNPLLRNEMVNKVFSNDDNIAWLNLCHYLDSEGLIHYDTYFDTFPSTDASTDCTLAIGELRNALSEIVETNLPFNKGDQVFLYSRLGRLNVLIDILVKNGFSILNGSLYDENKTIDVDYQHASTPLNLYMITKDVNIVFPMPDNKDILVYESEECLSSELYYLQIRHTNSDMMGNRWVSVIYPDGERRSSLCIKSTINYNTNISAN